MFISSIIVYPFSLLTLVMKHVFFLIILTEIYQFYYSFLRTFAFVDAHVPLIFLFIIIILGVLICHYSLLLIFWCGYWTYWMSGFHLMRFKLLSKKGLHWISLFDISSSFSSKYCHFHSDSSFTSDLKYTPEFQKLYFCSNCVFVPNSMVIKNYKLTF